MKALVGAFNQEKALVGAFSVIVQLHRLIDLRHYNTHCHGDLVTEGGGAPLDGRCYSVGPPVYSWDQILIGGLSNIPDIEASSL